MSSIKVLEAAVDAFCAGSFDELTAAEALAVLARLEVVQRRLASRGLGLTPADAISLRLTVAVRANAQWAVERELRRRILIAFDENGIRPLYLDGLSRPADELLEKSSR